jgi:predicted SprT family Zn-dependent metalloprotease
MSENESQELIEKKKKGRKPTTNNYFDEREENAVRMFLASDDSVERNKIYNDNLKGPLDKMISSIIRRYKLYRKDMDYDEIHNDTHSFLMTKIEKFKPSKEKKAYSYFGTICKNYLMGQIMKDQKEMNRKISYEDISSDLSNNPAFSYHIDNDDYGSEYIIKKFLDKLKDSLDNEGMSDQEHKLGAAIYDLFENYGTIFPDTNNNKFNKNIILFELREMTNLSTKEIRNSIKKYKKLYFELVQEILKK